MKILKRNQVIILVIAVMLIAAGYLNFSDENVQSANLLQASAILDTESYADIGDATLVSGGALVENEENIGNNTIIEEEQIETSADTSDYFTDSKLERDKMYSQMIESYQKIIDSNTITSEQKAIAQNEITKINEIKNSIMIAENLIQTKGFKNVVIFINSDSVNVILEDDELTTDKIAQIQNIISREMGAEINNIHITNK